MNTTHCPNCQKDIGVWSIYKAGLPNMLKCPHCKSKLKYQPSGWKMVIISSIIVIPIFLIVIYLVREHVALSKSLQFLVSLGVMLVAWTPFEIYFAWKLRKDHELVLKIDNDETR